MRFRLRFWFWKTIVHETLNRLAWRFACPDGPMEGRALRIDKTRLWWRLNDWAADRWIPQYVAYHEARRPSDDA